MPNDLHEDRLAMMFDDIKQFIKRDPDWTYTVREHRLRGDDGFWYTQGVTLTVKINGGAESEP